jgi:hypothetical protein
VAISEIILASALRNNPDEHLSVRLGLTADWIIKRIAAAGRNYVSTGKMILMSFREE